MTRTDTDAALAAERAEADATAVELANTERHVNELLSACVIKDDTINKQAVELDEAKAYQATLLQRIKELEAQTTPANPRRELSGVRVFPHYTNVYGDYDKILTAVGELGVGRVTGQLAIEKPSAHEFYKRAYEEHGVRAIVTVGKPREVLTSADWDKVNAALDYLGPAVEMTMNWNEPNHQRNAGDVPLTNWVRDTVAHQKKLAAVSRAHGVKAGTPQLWSGDVNTQFADLSKLVAAGMSKADYDVIVWHLYPRNADTAAKMDAFLTTQETEFRKRLSDTTSPIYASEWGLFTAPNYQGGAVKVTEQQRADRLPLSTDWYASRGYGSSYFELWNDPDSSGANREAWLGLVWADGTRTPGFQAYRDWIAAGGQIVGVSPTL